MVFTSASAARRLARCSLVLAIAAAALVSNVGPLYAVQVPRTLTHQRPVSAAPVEVPFGIDFVGLGWDGPEQPGRGVEPAVRFRHGHTWGTWQTFEADGADAPGGWASGLIGGADASAYQVRGVPASARGASVVAINTTDGALVTVGYRPVAAADAIADCQSRADWGADESMRAPDEDFDYHRPQVMTLHHTVTRDGSTDGAAVVRGIYAWHTGSPNDYDDIAYNYLVDARGRVYEGRWSGSRSRSCVDGGGDGSDFAHHPTDEKIVRGAHTGSYNAANIGIAFLGDFSESQPSSASVAAAEALLTELSLRHGFDPGAEVEYVNPETQRRETNWVISGHKDWDNAATACPAQLHELLPEIRDAVAARVRGSEMQVVRLTQRVNRVRALVVTAFIADDEGNAIEDAAVTIRVRRGRGEEMLDATLYREGVALTGATGHARFLYPDVRRGCYRVYVRDVTLEGRAWDGYSPAAIPGTLCI